MQSGSLPNILPKKSEGLKSFMTLGKAGGAR